MSEAPLFSLVAVLVCSANRVPALQKLVRRIHQTFRDRDRERAGDHSFSSGNVPVL